MTKYDDDYANSCRCKNSPKCHRDVCKRPGHITHPNQASSGSPESQRPQDSATIAKPAILALAWVVQLVQMEGNLPVDPCTPAGQVGDQAQSDPPSRAGSPQVASGELQAQSAALPSTETHNLRKHGRYLRDTCGIGSLSYSTWWFAVGKDLSVKEQPIANGYCAADQQPYRQTFKFPKAPVSIERSRSADAQRQAAKRLRDSRSPSPASDSSAPESHSVRTAQRDSRKLKDAYESIATPVRKAAAVQSFLDWGPVRSNLDQYSNLSLAGMKKAAVYAIMMYLIQTASLVDGMLSIVRRLVCQRGTGPKNKCSYRS